MQLTPEVVRWCQFIGFLLDRNESAYRRQTDSLVTLCMDLCLKLTPVEITVDFKMKPSPQDPRYLHDCRVESMKSSRFPGSVVSQTTTSTPSSKKAQQRMCFLQQLKKFNLLKLMMVHFYSSITVSILTSSITI